MNKFQIDDKVYCYFADSVNDINMITFDDFGVIIDIKKEVWIHPESKNRHEYCVYTVKTQDDKIIVIDGESNYKIVGLQELFSSIEKRIDHGGNYENSK